jgi:hypothetical protein
LNCFEFAPHPPGKSSPAGKSFGRRSIARIKNDLVASIAPEVRDVMSGDLEVIDPGIVIR